MSHPDHLYGEHIDASAIADIYEAARHATPDVQRKAESGVQSLVNRIAFLAGLVRGQESIGDNMVRVVQELSDGLRIAREVQIEALKLKMAKPKKRRR